MVLVVNGKRGGKDSSDEEFADEEENYDEYEEKADTIYMSKLSTSSEIYWNTWKYWYSN